MKQTYTGSLRDATINYWANFVHARAEQDVARVHAFQALLRAAEAGADITDDQITEAYGGRGWAPTPVCYECGARSDSNVLFGPEHDISLCPACIDKAAAFRALPKTNLFTRLFRKGA